MSNVSWDDAQEYIAWLSRDTGEAYRLPTEAEWEYAARAGTTARYWWGDAITPEDANCGYVVDNTTEVGSYPANPWGLHDMLGNASEWIEDRYHDSYESAPSDGSAWLDEGYYLRVIRGGSYFSELWICRSAFRNGNEPFTRSDNLGFRVARILAP